MSEVSIDDCDDIRALRAKGLTIEAIADRKEWTYTTTRRHAADLCWHREDETGDPEPEEMARLLATLAEELERIPTQDEWDAWDGSPCSSAVLKTEFDTWRNAHAAAGLPVIGIDASELVREVAYQKPELTASTEEVYQANTQRAEQHAEVDD